MSSPRRRASGHLETALDLRIGEVIAKAQVIGVKVYTGEIEFRPDSLELSQRYTQAPAPNGFRCFRIILDRMFLVTIALR